MIALSEKMSVEKTSKPKLKRRRCHLCGQFAGGNHVCASSNDIELHADEPLGVLYKIPKTSVAVSPVMVNDIQNCLTTLGLLQFLRPDRRAIPNETFLCSMRPSLVTPVVGDGNCLFTSLAVALGLTHDCGRLIRDIIVSNMNFINFPRNSLQIMFIQLIFPTNITWSLVNLLMSTFVFPECLKMVFLEPAWRYFLSAKFSIWMFFCTMFPWNLG